MLVFGHIGLTLGAVRALSREIDARWVAAAALLPDLIDKPLNPQRREGRRDSDMRQWKDLIGVC
jgi:hypothetical protein